MNPKKTSKISGGIALTLGVALNATVSLGQVAPFGGEKDINYAADLWQVLVDANMAGEGAIRSFPYEGVEPHGFVLETFYTKATIDGHTGDLVIKRNL